MRILLFGMRCHFTPPVLSALAASDHEIAAVVLPGQQVNHDWRWVRQPGAARSLPMAGEQSVDSLCAQHRIPLAEVTRLDSEPARRAITEMGPDLIVVACFSRLIPSAIVDLARFGGVNLHPSLLPKLRGPDPLFWTLHAGMHQSGVTLHRLNDRFDSGPILAQRTAEIPAGIRIDRLERVMGQLGGAMLVESLTQWSDLVSRERAQNDDEATYAPNPVTSDFRVPTSWPVERAFRFIRGVASIAQEIEIFDSSGQIRRIRDAEQMLSEGDVMRSKSGDPALVDVPFADGVLRVISVENGY